MHLHASPTSADQEQQADKHELHNSTVDSETAGSDDSASSGGDILLELDEDELFEERISGPASASNACQADVWFLLAPASGP